MNDTSGEGIVARLGALGSRLVRCPRKLRRRELELDTLLELRPKVLGDAVAAPMQDALDLVERKLAYENAAVLLLDRRSGRLAPVALGRQGPGESSLEQDRAHVVACGPQRDVGITGWVCRTGEPALIGDVRDDPRYLRVRENIRSELCVPIRLSQEVVGVLNVETTRSRAYNGDDLRILSLVAGELSLLLREQGPPRSERPEAAVSSLVPICASCHKCRTRDGEWLRLESYFMRRDVLFTHGLCPDCADAGHERQA